jgi:hypothetical protein
MAMNYQLRLGDNREILEPFADNYFHAVVTDPPYGLNNINESQLRQCLADWLAGKEYQATGTGMASHKWDNWVPSPQVWQQCFRVLRPGGYLFAFAGTRTLGLMEIALRLAGFEIRDSVGYAHDGEAPILPSPLAWVYGQGKPMGKDIEVAIDNALGGKHGKGRGYNSTLKPSWEPIIVARKPLATVSSEELGALGIDYWHTITPLRMSDKTAQKNAGLGLHPPRQRP